MKIEDVKKLRPLERLLYWMRERHQIHLRRRAGKAKPWTDDAVLQSSFFTNPYRENDKVTIWFRDNIREPLRNDPAVFFATVAFRWFNLPTTGDRLWISGLLLNWDSEKVLNLLRPVREAGQQVFTGAFMINSPPKEPKLEAIVRRVNNVWKDVPHLLGHWWANGESPTMEGVHEVLTQYDGMGGFMAYEVVTDLRHTHLLENAPDKMTWCNPGPGCVRGMYRVLGRDFPKGDNSTSPPKPKDFMKQMVDLLALARSRLLNMPTLEMREIEHSLCEYDKYERVLWGDGKAKRSYKGV